MEVRANGRRPIHVYESMITHKLSPSPRTLQALDELKAGVIAATSYQSADGAPCSALHLQTAGGSWVCLQARAAQLQFKFAALVLHADIVRAPRFNQQHPLVVPGPVSIAQLCKADWFDAALPTSPSQGLAPPVEMPAQSYRTLPPRTAYCHYLRGIELRGRDERPVVVCVSGAAYALHVTGIYEHPEFIRETVELMPVEAVDHPTMVLASTS